ncbi:MAG: LD-carboxypeptidase [Acidobacteria bacterium]|nr:LD-carboxypeptidase [Acidobacteriota bacterium]
MLTRRHLLACLAASPLLAAPKPTKPERLREGDMLGMCAPSGNTWEDEDIRFAIETVESLGFRVKPAKNLYDRDAYLAGADRDRAAGLNALFADGEVAGIIALRGGYGAQRILPYLDFDLIGRNPKPLMGYSDITALLNAIHVKTGLVGFHGPIAGQTWSEYAVQAFQDVLVEPKAPLPLGAPPPLEDPRPGKVERENRLTTIVGGKARGLLVGGNLTLLSGMLGTPYAPDFRGKILFFEDTDEAPYRIDRMLTQLWLAGALEAAAGFAIGKFTEATPGRGRSRSIEAILRDRFEPLGKPALRGLMIGHIPDQGFIPVGCEAALDADAQTLTLLEPGVR